MIFTERLQKLQQIFVQNQLDAAAFIPSPSLRYLTGANLLLNERPMILIIPKGGKPAALVPNLDVNSFTSTGFEAEIFPWLDENGYEGVLREMLAFLQLGGKKVAVEGIKMRLFEGEALRRLEPNLTLVEADLILARLRFHKGADEIANLREAIRISEEALRRTIAEVKIGMTEVEIANMLVSHMNALGSHGNSFEPLVLAGENSARPHGHPRGDYRIQRGDPLLFDFGAIYNGYPADITRTFFVGEASAAHQRIYETVKLANQVGRETGRAGITAEALDRATRDALEDNGFGHLVAHRTGHGLGLDLHEDPSISIGNPQALEVGMVFTIEPGLYEAGSIGVRIEDNMVVTENGLESLTTFPRDLMIIGS